MRNFTAVLAIFLIAISTTSFAQNPTTQRSTMKIGNNEMPNSLRNNTSMNMSVGNKNTPVDVLVDGNTCIIKFGNQGGGYSIELVENRIIELSVQAVNSTFGDRMNAGLQQAGGVLASGASKSTLVGGAFGGSAGAGIVSAAVSSVSTMANAGGPYAAAASGRMKTNEIKIASGTASNNLGEIGDNGEFEFKIVVNSGSKSYQVVVGFSAVSGVLKTKHDTVKNSISNVR